MRRLVVGPASVPGHAERNQHPHGLGKQAIAFCENLSRRFQRAMGQKVCSPIEQVYFAGVKFRGALVLANRLQWIAKLLLDVAQQVMKRGIARVQTGSLLQVRNSIGSLALVDQ